MSKSLFKAAVLLSGILFSQVASASYYDFMWQPRLGLQYQFMNMRIANGWDTITPKKFNHIGFMFGAKIHHLFGFDAEYMISGNVKKNTSTGAGATILGGALANSSLTTKHRLNYLGLDLNGYIPINDNMNFVISPGFFVGKPKIDFTSSVSNATSAAIAAAKGKSRMIPRISLGIEYQQEDIGVKLLYRYVNSASARMDVDTTVLTSSSAEKPYRDTSALGLSIYMLV